MPRTRRLTAITAGALAAGLLAGCTQPSFSFNRDDNIGYLACRDGFASQETDDEAQREELLESAAANAAAAQTPSIRDTVDPPVDEDQLERVGPEDRGVYTVDVDALMAACEEVGFNPDDVEIPDPSD
jgi:hypothetical protein